MRPPRCFRRAFRPVFAGALAIVFLVWVALNHVFATECANPDSLSFMVFLEEEQYQSQIDIDRVNDSLRKVRAHLMQGKQPKITVYPIFYKDLRQHLIKQIDIAILDPSAFSFAKRINKNLEVFAAKDSDYVSVLITRNNDDFKDIGSLKDAKVALVDPTSTSGYWVPLVAFADQIDRRRNPITRSHDASIVGVYNGEYAAAFVASYHFDNFIAQHQDNDVKPSDFKELWRSDRKLNDPVIYRSDLCEPLRSHIETVFLQLHEEEDTGDFFKLIHAKRFIRKTSKDYQYIRELEKSKKQKEKPRGKNDR